MLRIRPTVTPRTDVSIRTKRPPMAYIEILSASEDDFRSTVRELEADPLFRELQSLGAVRRRGGRGRMPAETYERRLDDEVREFLEKHDLLDKPDALEKIRQALDENGAQTVARRLGAPIVEVRRLARFLSEREASEPAPRAATAETAPDIDDYVSAASEVDITEATETVRDFVERFSVSEPQLITDFLHSDEPADALARRYRTAPDVIQRVMDAVSYVLTADILGSREVTVAQARADDSRDSVMIVARVYLHDDEAFLHFGEDTGYGLRYVIAPDALGEIESGEDRERAEELIGVLRHVNQRRSVQCRSMSRS